ncbi:MAG: 16S rRNA (guanine(966)-N(2))-methyltransferase RsmD [Candidatus Thermochlorobacter aerophilum]|uniref:16S rRNA (Guanine(966)-N(2))-methyltransferase RsmD n=1 Tax=Candidatus Thermochlorobacter aerophilus TaxID=1868324 RepID=A0A395LX83_9BACT|nr:MAG: 16S rRNA (guanine(966)-N(2))-methyltransferase RsmD [Candidatus Thermochlorobacter aerophilum]
MFLIRRKPAQTNTGENQAVRIIAGKFKRRVIRIARGQEIRPTTDRVRQAVFDTLAVRIDFADLVVLDLFAGSGILGIEALSRGAAHCTFVENNRSAVQGIAQSIKTLHLDDQTQIMNMDAMRFLSQTTVQYDLIFADPPYNFQHHQELLEKIFSHNLLSDIGYVVMEHHKRENFSQRTEFLFQKEFGKTVVSFFATPK